MLNLTEDQRNIYIKYSKEIRKLVNSPWGQPSLTVLQAIDFYQQKEDILCTGQ